jgi:hypothetical protein
MVALMYRLMTAINRLLHLRVCATAVFVFVLSLCIYGPECAFGQPILRSEITPEGGGLDDLFLFTVTIDGPQERVTPQLEAGGDFEVQLLGPKTSVSIVNGVVRTQQAFVYQLTPKRTGSLKTPEVQATIGGQLISAQPIGVTIRGAQSPPADTGAGPKGGEQIFMNQTAIPRSVYLGQQIVNSIAVYTRVNLQGVRVDDETSDGFWQEVISDGSNSQKTINGQEYASVEIARALFPLRPGTLIIPQRKGIARVPVNKRRNPLGSLDPFSDDFFENFFQRTVVEERKLLSNDIPVEVKPLPTIPRDLAQFTRGIPVVGPTSLSAHYSNTGIKVGESKNVSVILSSEGNLNPIKSLSLTGPSSVKIYDGQTQVKHDTRDGRLITEKTFSFSVVPLQPGMIRIPGTSFAYFDPESGSYKLITTQDISLVVTGSAVAGGSSVAGVPPQSSPQLSPDSPKSAAPGAVPTLAPVPIAPPLDYKEQTVWEKAAERVSIQLALLILSATLAAIAIGRVALSLGTSRAAPRRITRRISRAATLGELEECLRSWAAETIPGARVHATFDELRAIARSHAHGASTHLSLAALIDELELARYGQNKGGEREASKDAGVESPSHVAELKKRLTAIIRAW